MKDDSDLLWLRERTRSTWASTSAGADAWTEAQRRATKYTDPDRSPVAPPRPRRWRAVKRGVLAGVVATLAVVLPVLTLGPGLVNRPAPQPSGLELLGREPVVFPPVDDLSVVVCRTTAGETRVSEVPRSQPWPVLARACGPTNAPALVGTYDVCALDPYVVVAVDPRKPSADASACAGGVRLARIDVLPDGTTVITGTRTP